MHSDAAVRRRALSPKELAAAFAGAQEISGTARRWKDGAHHPVALAIFAAQKAGWTFLNAVTLRDPSGQERSLVHGSPAALRQLLLQDLTSSNASRDACAVAQRLEAPRATIEDLQRRGVWLLPVQKLIRSRASGGLTRSEATRLVQAVTGQLWTGAVLARRGILASPECPHCGCEDTVFHRVWTCPFGQNARRDVASADLIRAAVAAGPTSPLFARAPGVATARGRCHQRRQCSRALGAHYQRQGGLPRAARGYFRRRFCTQSPPPRYRFRRVRRRPGRRCWAGAGVTPRGSPSGMAANRSMRRAPCHRPRGTVRE